MLVHAALPLHHRSSRGKSNAAAQRANVFARGACPEFNQRDTVPDDTPTRAAKPR